MSKFNVSWWLNDSETAPEYYTPQMPTSQKVAGRISGLPGGGGISRSEFQEAVTDCCQGRTPRVGSCAGFRVTGCKSDGTCSGSSRAYGTYTVSCDPSSVHVDYGGSSGL